MSPTVKLVFNLVAVFLIVGCGIKGPPLPPIEENESANKNSVTVTTAPLEPMKTSSTVKPKAGTKTK